jgi:hypothetical protein
MRVDLPDGESNFIHEPNVQVLAQELGESLEAASRN